MMAVQLRADKIRLAFVSAHAPHDGADKEDKEAFWQSLAEKMEKITFPTVLMIDANAKLGATAAEGIGIAFAEEANTNTPHFEDMIGKLWIPSTFQETIEDEEAGQGTWYRNGTSRLDYVGLPFSWKCGRCNTGPQAVEFAEDYKDHRLVVARIKVDVTTTICKRTKRKVPDRQAMATSEGKETIRWLAKDY